VQQLSAKPVAAATRNGNADEAQHRPASGAGRHSRADFPQPPGTAASDGSSSKRRT